MVQAPMSGSTGPSGSQIVSEAEKFAGSPYVYGAAGPSSFDCSGLVQYVLRQVGVSAPRTSEDQWGWVQRVQASQIGPGDLVFAQFPGDNAPPGHVGIYVGNGKVLSAEDPQQGVAYDTLADWGSNIVGYGKVPTANVTATGAGGGGGGEGIGSGLAGALNSVWGAIKGGDPGIGLVTSSTDPLTAAGSGLSAIATEFEGLAKVLTWLTLPTNWTRIFAGLAGGAFLSAGVWFLVKEAGHG